MKQRGRFSRVRLLAIYLISLVLCILLYDKLYDISAQNSDISTLGFGHTACNTRPTWGSASSKRFDISAADGKRSYYVHLPNGYTSSTRYPVIFAFTGKNMKVSLLERISGLSSLPAIIVYPQALRAPNKPYAWQGAPYSPRANDVQFVDQIIDQIEQRLCVDSARIYSVGISNGGGMSWLLSCRLSDRIAAFAMLAGAFYLPEQQCTPDRPAPLLNIHGVKDPTVPYAGSKRKKLPPINKWIRARVAYNQCADTARFIIMPTHNIRITTWTDCPDDAIVQNIELFKAHHEWPRTVDIPRVEDDNQLSLDLRPSSTTISTAQYIWYFLRQHSLPERYLTID